MSTEVEITDERDDDNWFEDARAEHPQLYAELESLIEHYGLSTVEDALENLKERP